MTAMNDDELMATLTGALAPVRIHPGPEEISVLHRALVARTNSRVVTGRRRTPVLVFAHQAGSIVADWIHRARHPIAVLSAAAILATGGVAAAGVATNTLPGPTRAVAFDLGLPVTSPSLAAAKTCIDALRGALLSRNVTGVRSATDSLRHELAELDRSALTQVAPEADQLLAQSDALLATAAAADKSASEGGTDLHSSDGGANPSRSDDPANGSEGGAGPGNTTSPTSGDGQSDSSGHSGSDLGSGGSGSGQTPAGPTSDGQSNSTGGSTNGGSQGMGGGSTTSTAGGTSDGGGGSGHSGGGSSGSTSTPSSSGGPGSPDGGSSGDSGSSDGSSLHGN